MKKTSIIIVFLFITGLLSAQNKQAKELKTMGYDVSFLNFIPKDKHCPTMEIDSAIRSQLAKKGLLDDIIKQYVPDIQTQKIIDQNNQSAPPIYTIPTIYHIIHNGEPVGNGRNIPQSMVVSQNDILNEDYSRTNPDTVNTPVMFQGVAAKL